MSCFPSVLFMEGSCTHSALYLVLYPQGACTSSLPLCSLPPYSNSPSFLSFRMYIHPKLSVAVIHWGTLFDQLYAVGCMSHPHCSTSYFSFGSSSIHNCDYLTSCFVLQPVMAHLCYYTPPPWLISFWLCAEGFSTHFKADHTLLFDQLLFNFHSVALSPQQARCC